MLGAKSLQLLSKTHKSLLASSIPLRSFAVELSSGANRVEVTSDKDGSGKSMRPVYFDN